MTNLELLRQAVDCAADQLTLLDLLPQIQDLVDAGEEGAQELLEHAMAREGTLPAVVDGVDATQTPATPEAAPQAARGSVYERGWPLPLGKTPYLEAFPHVRYDKELNPIGLKGTIENTVTLLRAYGIACRYNEMSRRIELHIPGMQFTSDNRANAAVSQIKSLARRVGLPVSELGEYIVAIAEANRYHPVRDWISSAPWDGRSRLQDLFDTLVVDYEYLEHRDALLRRWLVSAVAAAFCETPEKFEGVLTLQGEQGIGKTSWLLALAPAETGAVLDGFTLDPDNKDSVLQFNAHWIVELGELDGVFRKSDVAKLKSFLSKKDDALRRAYAAMESYYKRRTVSAATVNGDAFLVDATGNRRWWTVPVRRIQFNHGIDMQQLWAEVLTLYRAGEQWWLTDAESQELRRVNGQHEQVSPVDELIRETFEFGQEQLDGIEPAREPLRLTASGVAKLLGLPYDKKSVTNEIGDVLRRLTGKKSTAHGKGRYWELFPLPSKLALARTFAL